MKPCTKCGQIKPLTEFHNHKGTKDGKRPDCKACFQEVRKVLYEAKKPEILAKMREYQSVNAERLSAHQKLAHRRRMQNPEWVEAQRAKGREYGKANPDKRLERQHRRLERIAKAPANDFTERQWRSIKLAYRNRCAYCGIDSLKLQTDHVIPLARGGPHTAANIVPSCGPCNTKKGTSPAPPFQVEPLMTHL